MPAQGRQTAALELADAAAGENPPPPALDVAGNRDQALARIREIQARFPGAAKAAQQPRDPEDVQAELQLFARLRSQFKGPPLTSEEIVAAIERDSHSPERNPWLPEMGSSLDRSC